MMKISNACTRVSAKSARSPEKQGATPFCHFWHLPPYTLSENCTCLRGQIGYTRNVSQTTDTRGESRNNVRRTPAIARFFYVRMPCTTIYGWALAGVRLRTPVASITGLSTPPCARPPRLRADGGPSIKMEAAMRANNLARSEQTQSHIQQIVRDALRAAATAPTVVDALDLAGDALRAISEMTRGEVRHG